MRKKVCIVTASRSEYGLLRWVIDEVFHDGQLELQLVVTGAHLLEEQGYTYKAIEADGYPIAAFADMHLKSDTQVDVVKSMGDCSVTFADTLSKLNPDVLAVLGDRYELLPICSAALIMNIPIAHISGGDVTEGAIDNKVRNAITMLSTFHFPGTNESANRIIRMIGSDSNVYVTGETNIDNFNRIQKFNRCQLAESFGLNLEKKWVLCTYHPETLLSVEENLNRVKALCNFFFDDLCDYEIVITKANTDFGGIAINSYFEEQVKEHKNMHLFSSMGQTGYISILYQVEFMIGNSSSGIYESPYVGLPCINIGNRQKGRKYTANIITIDGSYISMQNAIETIKTVEFKERLKHLANPYGDGHSSERIVEHLKSIL